MVRHTGSVKSPADILAAARGTSLLSVKEQELYELEESGNFHTVFSEIGKLAATNAINENKALGIPVTFLQGEWVVRRMPDGSIERLERIPPASGKMREGLLKKGTVLHVRKSR